MNEDDRAFAEMLTPERRARLARTVFVNVRPERKGCMAAPGVICIELTGAEMTALADYAEDNQLPIQIAALNLFQAALKGQTNGRTDNG